MVANSPRLNSPTLQSIARDTAEDAPSKSMSGSNKSRQTRKLQLRNAGFRGSAMPTRKITPKSVPSSNWSSTSWLRGSSDVENVSPSGTRAGSPAVGRRESSGILQDIGNSTVTHRPKKVRQRLTSNNAFETGTGVSDAGYPSVPSSPPPPKSTIRQRSVKSKPNVSHRRRSVSAETSKYIEHLEAELVITQSRLSSITSPSVTREQSSRMRHLNAETKQLQEELSEWESKYEHRVQEEVDRHLTIETDLRARIRNLEQDAEDAKFRIQELETQVETTNENMQAVEGANVNLEKRLEIMSELLASTKIDLHAETPGRARKHVRPKSMLPRFPTASSLMGSPDRQTRTQPASPFSHSNHGSGFPDSPIHSFSPLDNSLDHTDFMPEAESVFSEDSATGDSMTSAENFDNQPNFNPWTLPAQQHSTKSKPARRMRRFGAGSVGPKPLILPTASHRGQYPPLSAPPLEHSKTTPAFFPDRSTAFEVCGSPISGRRRASTTANEVTVSNLAVSPFLEIPEQAVVEDSLVSITTPPSAESDMTTRRFSSIGAMAGRNLMEELSAARSTKTNGSADPSSESNGTNGCPEETHFQGLSDMEEEISPTIESADDFGHVTSFDNVMEPATSSTTVTNHRRTRSRSVSIPIRCSESAFTRLRILFGDLLRSPIAVARYLVQTAQARMRIPRPLVNVQWWLVGVLLGPMAKRRLLASSGCRGDLEDQPPLLEDTPGRGRTGDGLAYGTLHQTPPASPVRRASSIAGKGRKRAGSKMRCVHRRAKHSPWLWIKFSITLAFAIGAAFKDGPGSLLKTTACRCMRREVRERDGSLERQRAASP